MTETVDRLTPFALMVLGLLDEGDMHPYEMIRLMRQRHDDRLVAITNGTMYNTVSRLERDDLIAEVGTDREGNRPERTTYTVTAAGQVAVKEWIRRELARIDRPTEFRVALAEAHNLDRAEVHALLRSRHIELTAAAGDLDVGLRAAQDRGVPEQFLLEVEREHAVVAAELEWLAGLIDRLERRTFAWGTRELPLHSERYLLDRKAARL